MSFHLAALYSNIPNSTHSELAPIFDARMYINPVTNRFWSSEDLKIIAAYAGSVDAQQAYIGTPWRPPSALHQVNNGVIPTSPPGLATLGRYPLRIPAGQELVFTATQESGVAQDAFGLIWSTVGPLESPPDGESYNLVAIGAGPTVARQWTELSVIWPISVPAGRYAIIGGSCVADTGVAFRLILEGTAERPGMLTMPARNSIPHHMAFNGGLGLWGEFVAPVMPRLEVLTSTIQPVAVINLQLVPLSGQLRSLRE